MRFNQFCNYPWIKTTLKDISKKINAKNKNKLCKNVICNSAQQGLIRQIDYFDKEIAQNESIENYTIINKGDFVYNPRKSLEAPYGPVNIYNLDETGIVSPLYLCFSVKNINTKFLHYYFKSKSWHRFVYLYGDSGARHDRVSIKDEVFFSQQLSIPTSHEEIEKINDFLYHIEQRIQTQSKIIEQLKSQMKWIYDIVLNKQKATKVSLGMLCTIKKGKQINGCDLNDKGTYPFMNGGTTSSGYFYKYNTQENTISISEGGNSCGYIQFNKCKFWCGGHCYSLIDIKEQINNKYLYHFLKANQIDVMKLRVGSGLPNIQKRDLENFNIIVPPLNQQNYIANFLDVCEIKINLEEALLNKLKEQKKYLLSNMFI